MLRKVTITGADDNTPIPELLGLGAEFPFVEWGILVSKKQEGSARFPGRAWMEELRELRAAYPAQDVSMHLCGEWVRDILRGKLCVGDLPPVWQFASRLQINTHAQEHVSRAAAIARMGLISHKRFIFQLDGVNDHLLDAALGMGMNAGGLFDCSHGAGLLPVAWPSSRERRGYFGYAGGLGPENVVEQIGMIWKARGDHDFWIDMEGRVRDEEEHLDLGKVRKVLELCAPFADA
jgi:hypothetical protein